jgi:hypothetical protein
LVEEHDLTIVIEHFVAGLGPPLIPANCELPVVLRTLLPVVAFGFHAGGLTVSIPTSWRVGSADVDQRCSLIV